MPVNSLKRAFGGKRASVWEPGESQYGPPPRDRRPNPTNQVDSFSVKQMGECGNSVECCDIGSITSRQTAVCARQSTWPWIRLLDPMTVGLGYRRPSILRRVGGFSDTQSRAVFHNSGSFVCQQLQAFLGDFLWIHYIYLERMNTILGVLWIHCVQLKNKMMMCSLVCFFFLDSIHRAFDEEEHAPKELNFLPI